MGCRGWGEGRAWESISLIESFVPTLEVLAGTPLVSATHNMMGGGMCVGTHSSNGAWHALPRTSIEARDNLMPRRMRWPRCGHQHHSAQHAHHSNQRMSHGMPHPVRIGGCRTSRSGQHAAARRWYKAGCDNPAADAVAPPHFFVATFPHGLASTLPWHLRGFPRGPLAGSADKISSMQPWNTRGTPWHCTLPDEQCACIAALQDVFPVILADWTRPQYSCDSVAHVFGGPHRKIFFSVRAMDERGTAWQPLPTSSGER